LNTLALYVTVKKIVGIIKINLKALPQKNMKNEKKIKISFNTTANGKKLM
jgi:hypothetical protein